MKNEEFAAAFICINVFCGIGWVLFFILHSSFFIFFRTFASEKVKNEELRMKNLLPP